MEVSRKRSKICHSWPSKIKHSQKIEVGKVNWPQSLRCDRKVVKTSWNVYFQKKKSLSKSVKKDRLLDKQNNKAKPKMRHNMLWLRIKVWVSVQFLQPVLLLRQEEESNQMTLRNFLNSIKHKMTMRKNNKEKRLSFFTGRKRVKNDGFISFLSISRIKLTTTWILHY